MKIDRQTRVRLLFSRRFFSFRGEEKRKEFRINETLTEKSSFQFISFVFVLFLIMSENRRDQMKISSISPSSPPSRSYQRHDDQDRNESKKSIRNMFVKSFSIENQHFSRFFFSKGKSRSNRLCRKSSNRTIH